MKKRISLVLLMFLTITCKGQVDSKAPTNMQDIESTLPFLYGLPNNVASQDTSPGWNQRGQKILLTGKVYFQDGKTPAPNVLIYYYHTNLDGKYLYKESEKRSLPPNSKGQTHGYIRGWVKTDSEGNYSIYTVRPGAYPGGDEAAHIHLTIKEPDLNNAYWIDESVFDDDQLLTYAKRIKMENRGGSGVLRLVKKGELRIGERNIILGLNIPDYPRKKINEIASGKNIGEDIISFIPFHAWGPDKGTKTCPICKYGWYHGILYFVGNNPDWVEIEQWLTFLEAESIKRGKFLKVYFVYGDEEDYNKLKRERELENLGRKLQLENVALTFVPSFSDVDSEIYLNKINPETRNTFMIYRRSNIIDKFINLEPNRNNFKLVSDRLDKTKNEYFDMSK